MDTYPQFDERELREVERRDASKRGIGRSRAESEYTKNNYGAYILTLPLDVRESKLRNKEGKLV